MPLYQPPQMSLTTIPDAAGTTQQATAAINALLAVARTTKLIAT